MRRIPLFIVLTLIFISGCSLGIKQRWSDFNAYYNTFYNAKISYERGLRLVENQTHVFNPERPIRIHRTPVRAGQSDFEKAIEKSADILLNHDDTKWVDDALELIGKSYFYMGQFFSAEQKFNEILVASENETIRQRAVLWKGVIFLETNRYNEGLNYLNGIIISEEYDWNPQIIRELNLVISQLYVQQMNWEEAASALNAGLPGLRNEILRSRGQFLYGQVLEKLDRKQEALEAYGRLSRRYPEYQLLYLAGVRQNSILRELGKYEQSHRNFVAMSRDDKNFEQLADLNYEIARTLQFKGQPIEAYNLFIDLLYNSIRPPSRETISKTHYALAELYRFDFYDYRLAAAYYDSSSRSATDMTRLPENFNAAELARSFGDYARISNEIQKADSLLWLGKLPRDEFQAVITRIRDERLREYERQMRQDMLRGTTVVNVAQGGQQGQQGQETGRDNGFLNHKNPTLVSQASEAFAAVWDGRPLVDNWRRMAAVRQAAIARTENGNNGTDVEDTLITVNTDDPSHIPEINIPSVLNIDLSVIPFTEADQNVMKNRLAALEYELGNVFYLNLAMPDSALTHYERVVQEFRTSNVTPQALYTISDIHISRGDTLTALYWAEQLTSEYPASVMAERIASRLKMDITLEEEAISQEEIAEKEYVSLMSVFTSLSPDEKLDKLGDFMEKYPTFVKKPEILLNKAITYAEIGRNAPDFPERFRTMETRRREWNEFATEFRQKQTEAVEALQDTTLQEDIRAQYSSLADSTLAEPNLDQYFPYVGEVWDSTRVFLQRFLEQAGNSPHVNRANLMMQTIKVPESLSKTPDTDPQPVPTDLTADEVELVACDLLDAPVALTGGTPEFLNQTGFMDVLRQNQATSIDFEYEILIGPQGEPIEVALLSEDDHLKLTSKLAEILKEKGTFNPPRSRSQPVKSSCYFHISVSE